jgi:hypothetical protein
MTDDDFFSFLDGWVLVWILDLDIGNVVRQLVATWEFFVDFGNWLTALDWGSGRYCFYASRRCSQ